jgi:hypothetical protein
MKKWTVRLVSLYVFNLAVLLLIGMLLPGVRVGWAALWAAVILTLATLALKPLLLRAFRSAVAGSAANRSKLAEKAVQYALVFVVELIIWVLTVWFSSVTVDGWFFGYVITPLSLLLAWVVYDLVDDRVESKTGEVYDSVQSRMNRTPSEPPRTTTTASPADAGRAGAAREETADGLTPEQRRMLDEL